MQKNRFGTACDSTTYTYDNNNNNKEEKNSKLFLNTYIKKIYTLFSFKIVTLIYSSSEIMR